MKNVMWTDEERQALADEAVRLVKAGKATANLATFRNAQRVLPKSRRRNVSTIGKVTWFLEALEAARKGLEPPRLHVSGEAGTSLAPAAADAPEGSQARQPRVFWKTDEKQALCMVAARLLLDLEASGPRDALEKAQALVLPPERQRKIFTMTNVSDWFHPGLRDARDLLEAQRNAAAAAKAEAAAAAAAATAAASAAAAAAAPAPAPVVQAPPVPTPAAAPVAAQLVQHAPQAPSLGTLFAAGWPALRAHLVQEIAGIVAEGIQRGLASVQLAAPQQQTDDVAMSNPNPRPHSPFVADPSPKPRPPSILVAGLKGTQISQIKADFGSRLDLRFCGADESKDQLRAMTERADKTIAIVDFLSHSHTDIIHGRSPDYVDLSGGMTRLRQYLAEIASVRVNGNGHATA